MKPSDRFDSLIQYWAWRHQVPHVLMKRQMMAESAGDPKAVSRVGAMGLFQIMPSTARELGVNDPMNPDEAAMGASKYMARLSTSVRMFLKDAPVPDELDYWRFALAAYNCGFGYVRVALRRCLEDAGSATWASFADRLPAARYNGKYPRAAAVLKYVGCVLPPGASMSELTGARPDVPV